jgi:hypothetical protein
MKPAALFSLTAAFLLGCETPLAPQDAGFDASASGFDAGEPDSGHDAGAADSAVADAGVLAMRKLNEMPPSRSTHRAFWWAPTQDTRVLSGNHSTGPIADFWAWDGTQWHSTPLDPTDYPERKNPGMALDEVNQKLYIFGGTWSGYPRDAGAYTVAALGDFRSWDGTHWKEESIDAGPPALGGAALGYDSEHSRVVLFGGSDSVSSSADTWLFDGHAWSRVDTSDAGAPSPRFNVSMVFDQTRKKLMLFGGQNADSAGQPVNLADTWEWDGQAWHELTGAGPTPPGRGHHAMTWDPVRQRVVMMGGARHFAPIPAGSALDDFWEWDGAHWSEIAVTGPKPSARTGASLSFDPARGRLILYGGYDSQTDLSDLWQWDGQRWENRSLLPLPRSSPAFAQKAPNQEALLFGGLMNAGGRTLGDVWRWSSGKWAQLGGVAPSPRQGASLTYHRDGAVLVGGQFVQPNNSLGYRTDAWTLAPGSSDWQPISGTVPPPRAFAAIGYDPERNLTVLFGGKNAAGRLKDTWVWNGSAWTQRITATTPPERKDAVLLFDPNRRQLLLVGGSTTGGVICSDTWSFDGSDWKAVAGMPPAPTPRVWNSLAFDSRGRLWSFGGYDGTTTFADAARLENGAWRTAQTLGAGPKPRFGALLLDIGDQFLTVFGSESDFALNWYDFSDVWQFGQQP